MKLLQAGQLRIDQYFHMIVGHCITLLLDLLNKEQLDKLNTTSNSSLLCGLLRLLQCNIELLRKSISYHHHHDQDDEQQEFVQVNSAEYWVTALLECLLNIISVQ